MDFKQATRRARFNEVVGLLLLVFAVLSLLALLSYDARDATWFHSTPQGSQMHNWTGRVGATLAEGMLQLIGLAALLLPVVFAIVGWSRFRGRGIAASYGKLVGHAVLLLSLAALLNLLYGHVRFGGGVFAAGGMFGAQFADALRALLNTAGALLAVVALIAGSIMLTTRFSWSRMLEGVSRATVSGSRKTAAAIGELWDRRRRQAEKRAVIRKHSKRAQARAAAASAVAGEPTAAAGPSRGVAGSPRIVDGAPRTPRPVPPPPKPKPQQQDLPLPPGEQQGYALPPLELLREAERQDGEDERQLLERARQITDKFREFAVDGAVVAIHPGPVVTTFEFKPEAGVKYSKITGLVDDLCLALKAESVRVDRLAGRSTVGIEVPNHRQEVIFPRELLASEHYQSSPSKLTLALGKTINGEVFAADLGRMPHLLIAGATGAGKSVGLNGMIASLLFKATPADVRFIMIDTKRIELGVYADIPHLLVPVVTDPKHASIALKWAVREMEQRYRQLASVGVRNIEQFNELLGQEPDRTYTDDRTGETRELRRLPFIVIVIDEMADLMMVAGNEVEESIMRLAQMARAVGIHLILATQRPSVDVITGTIKANFPSRIAFRVSQRVDSRTIIDQMGAEQLLGRGDMLYLPSGSARLLRLHGGYITEPELHRMTAFLKRQAKPVYDESVLKDPEEERAAAGYEAYERDTMFGEAVRLILQEGQCSITLIQRRLRLGYARAARIVDSMEQEGIIGPADGSKPREVLVGPEVLETLEIPH